MNSIRHFVRTPAKAGLYAYGGIVGLGFLQGAYVGCGQHLEWLKERKEVTVGSNTYDPIVNTCRDVGHWGFNVLYAGFGSALFVATAPVSVPISLAYANEKTD